MGVVLCGDMMRKSIVFDKMTPDVFYCPQDKPTSFDAMFVKARPLTKLCEFNGRPLPRRYRSDCYNDVDETEFACKEKERIMVREIGSRVGEGGKRGRDGDGSTLITVASIHARVVFSDVAALPQSMGGRCEIPGKSFVL